MWYTVTYVQPSGERMVFATANGARQACAKYRDALALFPMPVVHDARGNEIGPGALHGRAKAEMAAGVLRRRADLAQARAIGVLAICALLLTDRARTRLRSMRPVN